MSQYVDCSSNNGTPDVAAYAAAGHSKLSVKVGEGTGYHWFGGEGVIDRAHAHGLTVEHYHWLRPDSDAKAQADFFLRYVEPRFHHGDDVMTDFERTYGVGDPGDARRADQLAGFNERVTTKLARPRVYTGNWYLDGKTACQAECRRWDVVMSDYSGAATLPNPYGLTYVAWQFTDRAHVAGFSGPVDYNRTLHPAGGTSTGTDSGSQHQLPTNTSPQEASSMFEIIYDQDTRVWYGWAPGYWLRFGSAAEVDWAAASPLCVNGRAVRGVLAKPSKAKLDAIGVSNAHVVMRKHTAVGG